MLMTIVSRTQAPQPNYGIGRTTMANLDFSAIDNLIQEIQNTFDQIKSDKTSKFQTELSEMNPETNGLKTKIYTKLDELAQAANNQAVNDEVEAFKKEFDDSIAKITNTLSALAAGNKPVVKVEIDTLKQETDTLVTKLTNKLDELAGQDLSALKQEVTDWREKINKKLDELVSISEVDQKTNSLILDFKSSLVQLTSAPELQEKTEVLIQELKTKMAEALPEAEVTKLLQKIDTLITEIKPKNEVLKLNQRINSLIEKAKNKVAGFSGELDREVQSELGKLIKILGIAQIELEKSSTSSQIIQIKAIVDYTEISIDSLIGKPNLILAQKLRYASKTRLRKIQGGWMHSFADWKDDIFHAIKPPTKVLLGVALAVPLSWLMVNLLPFPPVKKLLLSLPAIEASPTPTPTLSPTLPPSPTQTNPPSSSPANGLQTIDPKTLNFVILLIMTGTLGGVVSILTRIEQFDNPKTQKYEDDFLPIFIGMIKPVLGGSFAFFIFLLLNSGVSPIEIKGKGTNTYFYGFLALAFIAGFSERFVPDLISQVEKTYAPPQPPGQGQGLPPANLSIQPSTVELKYEATQTFKLNPSLPSSNYKIGLTSDKNGEKGTIATQTESEFVYTAPTRAAAADSTKVTITVTSNTDPQQTATATVTLTV